MLLSTAYFPPVAWFALAARDMTLSPDRVLPSSVLLEACENYQKQSYRNRCYILASDGPQMLQVPVVHGHKVEDSVRGMSLRGPVSSPMRIQSVQVDYSTPWMLRTQRALDTAYETAAWYEYYRDSLFSLMDEKPETLWGLNLSLINWCLEKCAIACKIESTADFAAPGSVADDYRYAIHPKRPDDVLQQLGLERPYYQVFRERMGGFVPGMSILDLLFNEGPDSILWLKKI